MGLPLPLLRFLAREHRRESFTGSVLLLGRQCVYATPDEILAMLLEERITPAALPPNFSPRTNMLTWQGTPNDRFASDAAFFRWLGCREVMAMDVSNFEGAEIVADLNRPIESHLEDRFDLIIDSGTLEHVFDLPQGLKNLARMLRVGGRVLHFSPTNNYTNHGFYQICPTLYRDFYQANHFEDVQTYLAEQDSHRDPTANLSVYEIPASHTEILMSRKRLLTLAVARKVADSSCDQIPMQSFYAAIHNRPLEADGSTKAGKSIMHRLKQFVPTGMKTTARRIVPGLDPNFRPWRLKFWGRL